MNEQAHQNRLHLSSKEWFIPGNSQMAQWLGLHAFAAMAQVQSLVGELRSCMPHSMAKKKKEWFIP